MSDFGQLVIIWACVYVANIAAAKTKLTPVLFFLALGSLMVNLGYIPSESSEFIRSFAELGIIVIMFALGFEENSQTFVRSIKKTWGIAFFGALAPFLAAFWIAEYFWQDRNLSIMFGLAMMATAVSLTMVSLKSEGLQSSRVATGIMTSAVLDDIAALALVAILVPVASGEASVSVAGILWIASKAVLFFVAITLVGGWIFPKTETGWFSSVPLLGKFYFGHLLNLEKGEHTTLILLLFAVSTGLISHELGFHPAVGAYMAGLILREEYFERKDEWAGHSFDYTRKIIDNIAFSWLGPVFFVVLGSKLIIDGDVFIAVLPQTFTLTISIFVVQIISAALAARYTAGFNFSESIMIGLGMLGRAELAFVVIDIAYTQHAIFSDEAFYTLMFSAFWLNVAVPISIRLWKPHLKLQPVIEE